jgi:hypothetical protein
MLSPDSSAHYKETFRSLDLSSSSRAECANGRSGNDELCAGFNMSHAAIDGNPES